MSEWVWVCVWVHVHVYMCTHLLLFLIGVNSIEIVLSQILSFFIVLVIQTVIMFIVITYAFDVSLSVHIILDTVYDILYATLSRFNPVKYFLGTLFAFYQPGTLWLPWLHF